MIGSEYKSVHGVPTITATQALRLEANIPYANCTLRGVVASVCPLRPREFCKGNVFSACIVDNATNAEIVVYFHNEWAIACSFITANVELSVRNFVIASNPNVLKGTLSGPTFTTAAKDPSVTACVTADSVVSVVSTCDFTDKQTRVPEEADDDTSTTKECIELTLSIQNLDQPQCRVVTRHKRNFNPKTNNFTVGAIKCE